VYDVAKQIVRSFVIPEQYCSENTKENYYEHASQQPRRRRSTSQARPDPGAALTWAVGRFELGCGRESALDGLSDHLLALRAVLEGPGPVGASLPMRAAALIAEGSLDRAEAHERIEQAIELERSLMNGARSDQDALQLARWLEGGVRTMLREAALGELGTDIGTAADETLIATGLAAGDLEIAVTAQPVAPQAAPPPEEDYVEQETRIMEPIPEEDEIRITATPWLDEVEVGDSTLDFPAVESDLAHRERVDTPRVRHLFPVPEDADWEVRELDYDHYNRRAG